MGLNYGSPMAYGSTELLIDYDAATTSELQCKTTVWAAQGFLTPAAQVIIRSISLECYNIGAIDTTLTALIRAADALHKPTGGDLSSGSIPTSPIPGPPSTWHNVPITPVLLSPSTEYCVVFHIPNVGDNFHHIKWDSANAHIATVIASQSSDSGVTWTAQAGFDQNMRIYGQNLLTGQPTYFKNGYRAK